MSLRRTAVLLGALGVVLSAMCVVFVAPAAAAEQQIDGVLRVYHRDSGNLMLTPGGDDGFSYALDTNTRSDENPAQLLRIDGITGTLPFEPNTPVRVTGTVTAEGRLAVAGASAIVEHRDANTPNTADLARAPMLRDRTLLVIVVDFDDLGGSFPTASQLRDRIFTGHGSANDVYSQSSYGRTKFVGIQNAQGDITPPISVHETGDKCDSLGESAAAKVGAAGFNFDAYDDVVYILTELTNCDFSGMGSVSGKGSWIVDDAWNGQRTIPHELGHNSGLYHAARVQCIPQPGVRLPEQNESAAPCLRQEYGDPSSLMGAGSGYTGFQGVERARLGWMPAANVAAVQGTGSFRIATTDANVGETQLLQLYRDRGFKSESRYFYLGLRSPTSHTSTSDPAWQVGADSGLSIMLGPGLDAEYADDALIDAHPVDGDPYSDGYLLLPGETYTDPHTGMQIRLDGIDGDGRHANISVTTQAGWVNEGDVPGYPMCGAVKPVVDVTDIGTEPTWVHLQWKVDPCSVGASRYVVDFNGTQYQVNEPYFDNEDVVPGTSYPVEITTVYSDPAGGTVYGQRTRKFTVTTSGRNPTGLKDTKKPTRVIGLRRAKATRTSITLAWKPAKDNVKVVRYDVWRVIGRKTVRVAMVRGKTVVIVKKLKRNARYVFMVSAVDASGNSGLRSAKVVMRTAR